MKKMLLADETSLSIGFEFANNIVQSGTAAKDKGYFGSPGANIDRKRPSKSGFCG